MTKEEKQRTGNVYDDKQAHQREILHCLHLIQGQLQALAKLLEASGGDCHESNCEDLLLRAVTIEKGLSSLGCQLVMAYLCNDFAAKRQEQPDEAKKELGHLLKLMHR